MNTIRDQFLQTIIDWVNVTGRAPAKLGFTTNIYLALAAQLDIHDPKAVPRVVYDRSIPTSFKLSEGVDPTPAHYSVKTVQVGSSFIFARYGDPVIVEEVLG